MTPKKYLLSKELCVAFTLPEGATLTLKQATKALEGHLKPLPKAKPARKAIGPKVAPFMAASWEDEFTTDGSFVVYRTADLRNGKLIRVRDSTGPICPNCGRGSFTLPPGFEPGKWPSHIVCGGCGKTFDLKPIPDEWFGLKSPDELREEERNRVRPRISTAY